MAISIKNIRVQLHLSLEQLAAYLGVTRSRVHQYETGVAHESGEIREKIEHLYKLLSNAQKKKVKSSKYDDKGEIQEAAEWLEKKRQQAEIQAKELGYRLEDMKAEYTKCMAALNHMAQILEDPMASKEIKNWIIDMQPSLISRSQKIGPKAQASILLSRDEALGRAYDWSSKTAK